MFCFHKWQTSSTFFTDKRKGGFSVDAPSYNKEFVEKCVFGFTTIIQICIKCNQLKCTYCLGNIGDQK